MPQELFFILFVFWLLLYLVGKKSVNLFPQKLADGVFCIIFFFGCFVLPSGCSYKFGFIFHSFNVFLLSPIVGRQAIGNQPNVTE